MGVADPSDLKPFLAVGAGQSPFSRPDKTNAHEAAVYLGCTESAITQFVNLTILPTNGDHKWKLNRADVEEFRRRYMLSNEIAIRCGCLAHQVKPMLAQMGVHPQHRAINIMMLIWNRKQVERALGMGGAE